MNLEAQDGHSPTRMHKDDRRAARHGGADDAKVRYSLEVKGAWDCETSCFGSHCWILGGSYYYIYT